MTSALAVIPAVLPFGDDALEVTFADGGEQLRPAAGDVIQVDEARLHPRHDGAQSALPLEQLMLLHRHYIWANVQREAADNEARRFMSAGESFSDHYESHSRWSAFLFAWYGFLFGLIEGLEDERAVVIIGPLRGDIWWRAPRTPARRWPMPGARVHGEGWRDG